jgi:hypothetical protein
MRKHHVSQEIAGQAQYSVSAHHLPFVAVHVNHYIGEAYTNLKTSKYI